MILPRLEWEGGRDALLPHKSTTTNHQSVLTGQPSVLIALYCFINFHQAEVKIRSLHNLMAIFANQLLTVTER